MTNQFLSVLPEVRDALRAGDPVVSLESTIISHGMAFPDNVETALQVESAVRNAGAVPATIAIIDGRVCVGLTSEQLHSLGRSDAVRKVSRRDLPIALASRKRGATTVAATMFCAKLAGIHVLVTGGIGGVHRDGQSSLDISADLSELANTSIAVVCSGAKAILDIPRTLEMIETYGVPVIGFRTDTFPAFFSTSSGLPVDVRLDDAEDVAVVMDAKWSLGLAGAVLVATPVPEHAALDYEETNTIIEQAVREAELAGIRGKELTPFLLQKIVERTCGRSLEANKALIKHNADVGARIAIAYSSLRSQSRCVGAEERE